ncbi:pre-mRNA-splicing factor Urn1p [Monosporozyma servazzii]
MASPWKQYKAPNGRKYYYNVETKETTWTDPYQRVRVEKKPSFAIPLMNGWYLIIFDNGEKLYLQEDQLYQRLKDEASQVLLNQLDKEKLILLIGIARGYNTLNSSDDVYDSILKEIKSIRQGAQDNISLEENVDDIGLDEHVDDIGLDEHSKDIGLDDHADGSSNDQNEVQERDENIPLKENLEESIEESTTNALVEDYSSSDDDESDDDSHIDKKTKLDEEPFSTKIDENIIDQYKQMFTMHKLNPYGLWSMEMNKCSDDPRFYLVVDDHDREAIFELWCGEYESGKEDETKENEEEEEGEELGPTKYHYLSHIMSKSNITKETIFEDIKSENKPIWKQFRINKMIPEKKEQREFVTKLLFYYKKYSDEDRSQLFKHWIAKHCDLTKRIDVKTIAHWKTLHSHADSSHDIETLLFSLESHLSIAEILATHPTTSYEYYVLGIKAKCDTLYSLLAGGAAVSNGNGCSTPSPA